MLVGDSDTKARTVSEASPRAWSVRADAQLRSPQHERVDELIAEAEAIKRIDYDRLAATAEEAFDLACETDAEGNQYRFGMASALSLLAHLSGVRGESDAALQQASQAMALLDSHEPSYVLGSLYLTMGWARYQTGDYVDSLNDLTHAQRIAERIDDQGLMAYVMDRIANVYQSTSRPTLALDLQQRALSIHRELGDQRGEALTLNNMTYTLLDLGMNDEALASAFGALHYAESTERHFLLMGVLDTVAEVYLRRGELDLAAKHSAQGLELANFHHSQPDRGDALQTTVRIAMRQGRYDEALVAAEEALSIAERHHRAVEEYTCHELLSQIQEQRGDIASALAHYRRFHELERIRVNEETASRLASLEVEHEVDTARKNAEIHRLRSLALQQEVEQQRIAQAALEAQASLDPLTGLFNRRHISVLSDDLARDLTQGHEASVILFDLDRFKQINDTYGHFAGDRALVSIARLLRENGRDADTPVRYGGDEFLVLLGSTGAEKSAAIAERLRTAIATQPIDHRGVSIALTVSVGVASVSPGAPVRLGRAHRAGGSRALRGEALRSQLRHHSRALGRLSDRAAITRINGR